MTTVLPHRSATPSAWVQRFAPLVPPGEVLDLACGGGRHARLFAARGNAVLAVDRNAEALTELATHGDPGLVTMQFDLEDPGVPLASSTRAPFDPLRFAGIVVTNYLHRPLMPRLLQSLAVGGVLIYETFASGNEQFGKPSNPDFLLQPGELLELARSAGPAFSVVAFEDGYVDHPAPAMVQRICMIRAPEGNMTRTLPVS